MSINDKLITTVAVAYSAVSLYDAVYHGVTGHGTILSDEYGRTWATTAGCVVAALTCTAFTIALVTARRRIDAGSWIRRWIRRFLTLDFAILAGVYAAGAPFLGDPDSELAATLGVVAGAAFLAMFVLAFTLGLSILRVPDLKVSAVLLIAVVPILGLTIGLNALGSDFAHPAYAETAIYLGVALLCRRPAETPDLDTRRSERNDRLTPEPGRPRPLKQSPRRGPHTSAA